MATLGQQHSESYEPHPLGWNCRQESRPEHQDLIDDNPGRVVRLVGNDEAIGFAKQI
jgi:hypothetical protein